MKNCPDCQHQNPATANFCNNCGCNLADISLASSSVLSTKDKIEREAERRQLTILFCDLVGSTPLSQQLDPEDYRNMITNYHRVAEKVIQEFGGYVAQYLGDGLLVYFGYPEGLEDAAKRSVQAGLGILNAMEKSNLQLKDEGFPAIQIRIGIHSGLVVVDDHLALGETVNVAARLEGVAPYNGLVISPQTMKLTQGWFNLRSTGFHDLKGITEPMEVFQVISESGVTTQLDIAKMKGLSPLVGRDDELNALVERWTKSKNSKGQVVLIHGEAGIGKSRLIDTIQSEMSNDQNVKLLIARCSSHQQNSAFYPIIQMLKNELVFGIKESEEKGSDDELVQLLKEVFQENEKNISLLLEFLSISSDEYPPLIMSPVLKREVMMSGISELLINLSARNSLCMILEDLHWADASSLEWMDHFVKDISDKRILLLSTTRPIDVPSWVNQEHVSIQYLQRLSVDDMMKICEHQTKGKPLPKEILHQIAMKTEGVPLFVEELTKMLITSEFLEEKDDGYEIKGSINNISIPSTLQDSLLARLDRLSNVKQIVQIGSVLGREFSSSMINLLLPDKESNIREALNKLVGAEILNQKSGGKESIFQFKHALIQDAAYSSLLKSKRLDMHFQIAEKLEEEYPNLTKEQPQILAFHYGEGGNPDKAIPLWLSAGQQSSQNNASLEAIAQVENGLSMIELIKEDKKRTALELDLLLTKGGMYIVSHGFPHPKVKETFDKARDVAQKAEVSPKLALIMVNLMSYYMNTEDFASHSELSKHMIPLMDDPDHGYWFKIFFLQLGGGGNVIQGDLEGANNSYKELLKIFDPSIQFMWELASSGYVEVGAKAWQMICLHIMGVLSEARQLADDHLTYADKHHDSMTLYHIHTFPSLYHLEAREWDEASKIIEIYLPIVKDFGDPVFILTAEVYHSIAEAYKGHADAFSKAIHLLDTCFQIGFRAFGVSLSPYISNLYLLNNDPQQALEWSSKILDHVEKSGSHFKTSELLRCKALAICALEGFSEKAKGVFLEAIEVSRQQKAKLYELRASRDLARQLHQNGKSQEGLQLLKEIYNWFEPDDSSIDLREVKVLIETINESL